MSSVEKLANIKPKENAGPRASNRFDYQINWGLQKLLKMEEDNEDYIMILDYHDDIVICNSEKDSDYIDFYQIKTKKAGQWGIGALNSAANASEEDDDTSKGDGMGILSKLISHTGVFENTRNLYFVTNSSLSRNVFKRSDDVVRFDQLESTAQKSFKDRVEKELGKTDDEVFDKLIFIQNQMSVGTYKQTMLGTLGQFLKDKFKLVTDVDAVYDTLYGELRRRNDYENEINSPEELIKHKSISHEEFSGYLKSLTLQKGFEEIKAIILNEISEEIKFSEKHKVKENLNTIYQDLMNYENDELWNLRSSISNVMAEMGVPDDVVGLWDYANRIYDSLMLTYINYKQHSEHYIKSLILYVYEQDSKQIV